MANFMRKLSRVTVTTAASLRVGTSAALAADLPSRQYAPAPVYNPVPVFTWSGFYAGVNGGYGWNSRNRNNPYFGTSDFSTSQGSNGGFVGGGQVGYNYQLVPGTGLVVGVEADLQYVDIGRNKATYLGGSPAVYSNNSGGNYVGTVRGRLGYAFDRFLVYGTGGFAYGDVARNRGTGVGYTLGGGIEYALTNNLTAKVEALYVNLGNDSNNTSALATPTSYGVGSSRDDFGVVRAGLNYKF
jgi:outer membrane immunogenic protein